MTICACAIRMKGMVLPRMNSLGRSGVTISCSMVPASFSRTTAIEVNRSESSITRKATIPGT